jgi:hypothetical protein
MRRVRARVCSPALAAGLALGVAAALAATPGTARAASGNAGATQAYVQTGYAALRVAVAHLKVSEAGPLHVLAKVRGECPQAGAQSPEDEESTQMSNEVIGAMVVSAIAPDVQAIRTFAHTVAGLHWSNGALNRSIHAYASKWDTLATLSAPNLCADVKAWNADGYRALPADTAAFVAKFVPSWVGAGFMPAQLSRYESAATRALARRTNALEEQVTELEAREVEHYSEIMSALAIWP